MDAAASFQEMNTMTYAEALSAIHSRKRFSSVASLERMTRLMERLGNPQDQIRCIHVAGTNGKGSVCAFTESILRTAGFHVGLFTSPYLVDFRERIQFDRNCISEEMLVSCFEAVMTEEKSLESLGYEPINEFELVTAIGFYAFAQMHVDYAVIEVGLGGRYDATNVLRAPEVCCITPISLDHTAVLGNTVAEIALEKSGIIKQGTKVVSGAQEPEAMEVIKTTADQKGCALIVPRERTILAESLMGTRMEYKGNAVNVPLLGRHQVDNALTAWEICAAAGISESDIVAGIERTAWKGRLQYLPGVPTVLIDAGHNPAGIRTLTDTLDTMFRGKPMISVMAMMRDKDYAVCIPEIARRSKTLIAASVGLPRSLPQDELAAQAEPYCEALTAPSVSDGIELAKRIASKDDVILVCGSVYAAGEAIRILDP